MAPPKILRIVFKDSAEANQNGPLKRVEDSIRHEDTRDECCVMKRCDDMPVRPGKFQKIETSMTKASASRFDIIVAHLTEATAYLRYPSPPTLGITAGLRILHDLLDIPSLASHPLHHALTHAFIAVNTPFSHYNACRVKRHHLREASQILYDVLGTTRHGGTCQGCIMVGIKLISRKGLDKNEEVECTLVARILEVIEKEEIRVSDFNRNGVRILGG